MRLAARLWLLGALVPFAVTVVAVLAAGRVFRTNLERSVDDALLAQAAVEAVSLFDGPGGRPHLHLPTSPLRSALRVVHAVALYEPDGRRSLEDPPALAGAWTDATLPPVDAPAAPRLEERRAPDGTRLRVLTAGIRSPGGERHALQLVASLAGVDQTVAAFDRTGVGLALAFGAALLVLQTVSARRLSARVRALAAHMGALREGDLDAVPPPPRGRDEIADLAQVVADATGQLRRARAAHDRLVADAAHELRTPLTLMHTSIDLALRRRREVPELVASLEDTRREVDRLAALATKLLDLATAGRGEWDRAPGDLAAVATEAAEAARAAAEKKGVLVNVEARGPVPARFDASGVRQAVDNLLANAIRYSPAGRAVTLQVAADARAAWIAVRDEGPGIAPADRERVFEPFERGGKVGGGAGLGLAIVREIARGHGGRAFVGDAVKGAEVVLELPRDDGAAR